MPANQDGGRMQAREARARPDINWVWILGLGALVVFFVFLVIRSGGKESEAPTTAKKSAPSEAAVVEQSRKTGIERFNKGKVKEAIPPLEKAVEAGKVDPDTRTALALAYAATGQLKKAQAQYEQILQDKPKDAATLYRLAVLKQQLNQIRESVKLLERAVAADPKTVMFGAELAKAYGIAGAREKALAEWQRVLNLTPPKDLYRANVLAQIADIYYAQNQKPKALALYKAAAAIDPQNPYIKQQLSRAAK